MIEASDFVWRSTSELSCVAELAQEQPVVRVRRRAGLRSGLLLLLLCFHARRRVVRRVVNGSLSSSAVLSCSVLSCCSVLNGVQNGVRNGVRNSVPLFLSFEPARLPISGDASRIFALRARDVEAQEVDDHDGVCVARQQTFAQQRVERLLVAQRSRSFPRQTTVVLVSPAVAPETNERREASVADLDHAGVILKRLWYRDPAHSTRFLRVDVAARCDRANSERRSQRAAFTFASVGSYPTSADDVISSRGVNVPAARSNKVACGACFTT